jgi:ATP-binding cassette subfamily B protein
MIFDVGGVRIGVLVAFLIYIRDFFRPLGDLSDKTNIFQAAMASCERIFALMDEPETVADPASPAGIDRFRGEVEFQNVHFAYDNENWVLKDVSFRISSGQSVALVGATGAGKTSIVSLVARLYDVQRGAIRVDGRDVKDYRQADLRRRVGVVLQDPFIFADTVAANIGLNHPGMTREQIEAAARYVNADGFIRKLPWGYDTPLQERGASLSTGQKQLLALARALAQDPDILLILDEATANVDTETEALIQDALVKLMNGRTTILIAHRLSTIKNVNRIFVMRHGEIIEEGSHAELIEKGGYYLTLYELLSRHEKR